MESSKIDDYVANLKRYNEHTNIYSTQAYDHLEFHIQNSLNIAKLIPANTVHLMDIGSGSGLPSIPLAIACPHINITAVESKSRKTKFLEDCKRALGLRNYHVVTANIMDHIHHNRPKPTIITAKAFAPIERLVPLLKSIAYTKATVIVPISTMQIAKVSEYPYPNYTQKVDIIKTEGDVYLTFKLG